MKKIKPLNGNAIIRIKHTMNDRTESGLYKDITFDVHGKMMITAEVIAVSDKGNDQVMLEIKSGAPRHDVKEIEPVYVRNNQLAHDIRVGDRIYFHYITLEDGYNFLGLDEGWKIYKVAFPDIFLSMRADPDGKYVFEGTPHTPHLHNQYVLGEAYWGEGWEEVEVNGKMIGAKVSNYGLVTETKDKPLENHAVITDIGVGIKPYSRFGEVTPGDVVLLTPDCEFINEVDNKERWVFTHEDIFGILKGDGSVVPVCDNLLIKLEDRVYKGNIEVDLTKLPLRNEGKVVAIGKKVDSELFEIGDPVKFQPKRTWVVDEKYAVVAQTDIYGILKYML